MSTSYRPECTTCNTSVQVSADSSVCSSDTCQVPITSTCCQTCLNSPCTCQVAVRQVWIPPTSQRCTTTCVPVAAITDQTHCESTSCSCNSNLYVTNSSTFTVPACGETATMYIAGARRVPVGTYLYADSVGYLKVTTIIDDCSLKVELTQEVCDAECNVASPGSTIAACTKFIVTALGCGVLSSGTFSLNPCLTTCFYSPASGESVTIGVSSVGNIVTGSIVSIGGYQYTVVTVIDSETITIRNDGDGAPTNTYFDCDDNCNYPVTVVTSPSPCDNDPVSEGLIVVCDGATQTTLEGSIDNQIPVWNNERGVFELEVLDQSTIDCTTLTCCLILDPAASPQEYLIEVADSSIFSQAQYQQFGNLLIYIDGDPFIILDIVDPTHIRVQPFFEVTVITEYADGAVICIADCCEQCIPVVETMSRTSDEETPNEILIVVQELGFSIPAGVSVRNYYTFGVPPAPTATTDASIPPPTDEGLFDIYYKNEGACTKYFELTSNWACVLDIPTDVFANVEYRTGNSDGDTQSFCAIPMIGNDNMGIADPEDVGYVDANQPGNLMQSSLKDLNTYKAMLYDRDFVDVGEEIRFYGHIRMTFNNTTGAPAAANFEANIRAWYKAWNYMLGPVDPLL